MYTLNELATMTGLTTRTLRTYLKTGLLSGEKTDGVWRFSEEDCERFFAHPSVKPALQAKRNALVYDFLGNRFKRENELCVVLDLLPQAGEAEEVSAFFCKAVSAREGGKLRFTFEKDDGRVRVILTGPEDAVSDILRAYYG